MRVRSLSGSVLGASGASDTNWGERYVFRDQIRTTLPSCRRPLGGCRINVNRQGAGFEPIFPKRRFGRSKIRRICLLDKRFRPERSLRSRTQAAGTGRIRPRRRGVLSRRRCFSAQRTDLSCRFRSVLAWIAIMRMTGALEGGGWLPITVMVNFLSNLNLRRLL